VLVNTNEDIDSLVNSGPTDNNQCPTPNKTNNRLFYSVFINLTSTHFKQLLYPLLDDFNAGHLNKKLHPYKKNCAHRLNHRLKNYEVKTYHANKRY
jgi:hypothetical protein